MRFFCCLATCCLPLILNAVTLGAEPLPYGAPILLPSYCNTPDAMEVLGNGDVILSVPNFTDDSKPGVLMRIASDNRVSRFCELPKHPKSGKVYPMGIRQAANGDFYVADHQAGFSPKGESRLLRVIMKNGEPVETMVVACGLNGANGVAIRGDYVYVTDSCTDASQSLVESGVFRFRLDEKEVVLNETLRDDPHFLASFHTKNQTIPVGADGITFDSQGRLYVSNCGDAEIYQITLDAEGNVTSNRLFAADPAMQSADGIYCDLRNDRIYVADILGNAVHVVSPDGRVTTLCKNGDSDGSDGTMDGPSEAIVRGNQLLIANFNRVFPGSVNTTSEAPHTLSVLPLEDVVVLSKKEKDEENL